MLSMSEKHAWLIQVKEIAAEMQRISWLGKKKMDNSQYNHDA